MNTSSSFLILERNVGILSSSGKGASPITGSSAIGSGSISGSIATSSGRGIIFTGATAAGGAIFSVSAGSRLTPATDSIPVATTETRTLPSNVSSKVEPNIMLESPSTSSRMRLAASSTSNKVMSEPAVILISTPFAPLIEISSSNGLAMACSAASVARRSPSASPVPIMALPISPITDLMSAKSRLIRPGITIRSVTPRTPEYSTSSAILKASAKVVFSFATRNKF